jgi:hypothetical protein
MNPPTVEGWHTGAEWIDSGTLVERINFAADQVGNTSLPGVREIVSRLRSEQVNTAEGIVDRCLEMVGAYELASETKEQLVAFVGNPAPGTPEYSDTIAQTLQLIVSTQEYQFA